MLSLSLIPPPLMYEIGRVLMVAEHSIEILQMSPPTNGTAASLLDPFTFVGDDCHLRWSRQVRAVMHKDVLLRYFLVKLEMGAIGW